MRQTVPVHYTIADHEHWEGDWELIDGIPVAMSPAPVLQHQRLVMLLVMELENSLEECEQCRVYPEAEWRLGDDTVFRPDGVVICYPPGRYLDKPPALIVEVLSPATAAIDKEYKRERYARESVTHYIIADPDAKTAHILRLDGDQYQTVTETNDERWPFDLGPCRASINFQHVIARLG